MDPAKASALARDPATPPNTLEMLVGLGLPFLREYVAVHPNATPSLLDGLAPSALRTDKDVALARALARNEATPADVLGQLLGLISPDRVDGSRRENWAYEELAVRVLAHPNCPAVAAQQFLATRELPRSLRCSVAQSVASVAALETLASDPSDVVSAIAAERLRQVRENSWAAAELAVAPDPAQLSGSGILREIARGR